MKVNLLPSHPPNITKKENSMPWPAKNRPRKGRRKIGSNKRKNRRKARLVSKKPGAD